MLNNDFSLMYENREWVQVGIFGLSFSKLYLQPDSNPTIEVFLIDE